MHYLGRLQCKVMVYPSRAQHGSHKAHQFGLKFKLLRAWCCPQQSNLSSCRCRHCSGAEERQYLEGKTRMHMCN